MTTTQSHPTAHDGAVILDLSAKAGFQPARVSGRYIFLVCPGAAIGAAQHLRVAGITSATATMDPGQWAVRV